VVKRAAASATTGCFEQSNRHSSGVPGIPAGANFVDSAVPVVRAKSVRLPPAKFLTRLRRAEKKKVLEEA
jgi:hypothetical protein